MVYNKWCDLSLHDLEETKKIFRCPAIGEFTLVWIPDSRNHFSTGYVMCLEDTILLIHGSITV